MKNIFSKILPCAALALWLVTPGARAFSLIGPFSEWQRVAIGYNLPGDIGGPMGLHEGFRWNVPTLTYAFDKSFIDYFGPDGVNAVDQAFQYFNDLDAATKTSADLSEYSTSAIRQNYEAGALGILDLKSTAMSLIIEQLGLADPVRYAWTLREILVIGMPLVTNYTTVQRNFDPVTLNLTPYVNDTLYTFQNQFVRVPDHVDAIESPVNDPVAALGTVPVASGLPLFGSFFTGLTRDDVGALRHLYHPNNYAAESLLATVTQGRGGNNPWLPFLGTNAATVTNIFQTTGTNNFINLGLRGGRNHLSFKRVRFDSIIGQAFKPITNSYTDVVTTNSSAIVQHVQRGIIQPDFLFVAEDLGTVLSIPALTSRTGTGNWIDNDALNGSDDTTQSSGPGVIAPPVRFSFSNQLPYFLTDTATDEFPGEDNVTSLGFIWGSFDATTNAPVIYPFNGRLTFKDLRQRLLLRTPLPE